MFRRPSLIAFTSIAAVAAALAIPSFAFAGNPATSPVDSVAASVASGDSSAPSSSTSTSAPSKTSVDSSDSPTASTYSVPTPDPCAPVPDKSGLSTVPESCVQTPPTTESAPVSGGGVVDDVKTVDAPEPVDVVSGSGAAPEPVVSGGGGPELPFTGLPLMYAIYAGIAFMLVGGAIWFRTRRA
jgi:hypothetical protein